MKVLPITLMLLLVTSVPLFAQMDTVLFNYLKENSYALTVHDSGTVSFVDDKLPKMLDERMKGKKLFIFGEGFSHNLNANGFVENMFIRHFSSRNLRYVFGEQSRSWIIIDNLFFRGKLNASEFYPHFGPRTAHMFDELKGIYQEGNFEFRAVDFERNSGFNAAVDSLDKRLSNQNRIDLYKILPALKDTSYMNLAPGKFVKFLEFQRGIFYKDSSLIRQSVGNMYDDYLYLLTDTKPSGYADNRNKNMAEHVLTQIGSLEGNEVYLQTCGIYHAKRKGDLLQKSMAGYLEGSNELKGKILITSIYCENCTPIANRYGVGDNNWQKFMKDNVLLSFQNAAIGKEMVLFDLTGLPEKYQFITKDYVDMLIFAKNQK